MKTSKMRKRIIETLLCVSVGTARRYDRVRSIYFGAMLENGRAVPNLSAPNRPVKILKGFHLTMRSGGVAPVFHNL